MRLSHAETLLHLVAEAINSLVNKEGRGCSQSQSSWMLPWRSGFGFWACFYHRVPKWWEASPFEQTFTGGHSLYVPHFWDFWLETPPSDLQKCWAGPAASHRALAWPHKLPTNAELSKTGVLGYNRSNTQNQWVFSNLISLWHHPCKAGIKIAFTSQCTNKCHSPYVAFACFNGGSIKISIKRLTILSWKKYLTM